MFSFTFTTPTVAGDIVLYTSTSTAELTYHNTTTPTGNVYLWVSTIANASTIPCSLKALSFTGLLTGTTDTVVTVTVSSF